MLAVVLGLASSLSWGIADFLGGLKSRSVAVLAVVFAQESVGLLLTVVIVGARSEPAPGGHDLLLAGLSAIAGTVGLAAFYRGMAMGTISVVAPISATAAVIPITVGVATGERPSATQGIGLAMAFAGVVLASREPQAEHRAVKGVGYALLAAVGFGTFFVLMDSASDADPYWAILANRVVAVGLLAVAFLAVRPKPLPVRADLPALAAIGILDVGANGLFAVASTEGLVSVVATLASLYPVVTILLARYVLHERLAPAQQFGVTAALAGVAAISAG